MKKETTPHFQSWFLIILFTTMICSYFWATIFQVEDAPKSEARPLASSPEFQLDVSLLGFPSEFENYYLDHFPLRYWLIQISHQVRYHIFRDRFLSSVIIGDQNYLHLGIGFERYTNICQKNNYFTLNNIRQFEEGLNASQKFLNAAGIEFAIGIIPEKCTIFPETIENYLPVLGEQSTTEIFMERMSTNSDILLIDISESLYPLKDQENVFMLTDTHWSPIGAYIAYRQVFTALNPEADPEDIIEWDYSKDFELVEKQTDMGRISGIPSFRSEMLVKPNITFPKFTTVEPGIRVYTLPEAPIDETLLVFHDSFLTVEPIQQFLAHHYQRSIFMLTVDDQEWTNNPQKLADLIGKWSPDIVLVLYVERNIDLLLSDN